MGHLYALAGRTARMEKQHCNVAQQASSDVRPERPGDRCALAVSPKITPRLDAGLCTWAVRPASAHRALD